MPETIYETNGRVNNLSHAYCEMAMESYYELCQILDKMDKEDVCDYIKYDMCLEKKKISVVVFSAMCVESFLNDYLAVCLGDKGYYENFDSLKPISKLQLICKLIFRIDIDKNALYYSYTKNLFNNRNDYVHNKSEDAWDYIASINKKYNISYEMSDCNESLETSERHYDYEANLKSWKHSFKLTEKEAEESLKAIKELATFFDQNDSGIKAVYSLFGIHGSNFYGVDEEKAVYKEHAFKMLKLQRKKK